MSFHEAKPSEFINFRVQLVSVIARLAVLFGINSTSNARNRTRRSRVLFVALRVL